MFVLRLRETACCFSYGYVLQMAVIDGNSEAYEAAERYSRFTRYRSYYHYRKYVTVLYYYLFIICYYLFIIYFTLLVCDICLCLVQDRSFEN
jgi:hypothetical protein